MVDAVRYRACGVFQDAVSRLLDSFTAKNVVMGIPDTACKSRVS